MDLLCYNWNMKAILTSTDLTKVEGGVELAEKMIGKPRSKINVAVINEASAVQFGDQRWVVDSLKNMADSFGGNFEIVHLLALEPAKILERVMAADMLFVLGGNTEWLKIIFDKTGFTKLLPEILRSKLYVGSSAGSMILGHRQSSENMDNFYGKEPYYGVDKYLDLLDLSFFPHLHGDGHTETARDEFAVNESKSVDHPVFALSDYAAIVVDSDEIKVIGRDYLKLIKGEIVERGTE